MAAPTVVFRGKATVEGVAGTFDAVATNATALNQGANITQNWELEELKDVHGYDAAWLFRNENATVDLDLFLVATTAAIAAAPVKVVTPSGTAGTALSDLGYPFLAPGSLLVLSGFAHTAFNATWQIQTGCDAKLTNTGAARYSIKIRKYANSDQQTALAVIPT